MIIFKNKNNFNSAVFQSIKTLFVWLSMLPSCILSSFTLFYKIFLTFYFFYFFFDFFYIIEVYIWIISLKYFDPWSFVYLIFFFRRVFSFYTYRLRITLIETCFLSIGGSRFYFPSLLLEEAIFDFPFFIDSILPFNRETYSSCSCLFSKLFYDYLNLIKLN